MYFLSTENNSKYQSHRNNKKIDRQFKKSNFAILVLINVPLLLGKQVFADSNATQNHYQFNISAGTMASALNKLAETAGLDLSYTSAITSDVRSVGLKGDYTPEQALQKLLSGSGLSYRFRNTNAVTLQKVAETTPAYNPASTTLPTVNVVDNAINDATDPYNEDYRLLNSSTATKTDTPIIETPFSVKAVPKQVLEDQQVIRVDKAVENISGVIRSGGNAFQSDSFIIRGFATGGAGNTYRNGVIFSQPLTSLSAPREVGNFERVEVLKGPASLLFGRAEPGGVINYVTKQALDIPYYSLQQQFGSFDLYRTTVDATGPVADNHSLLYRVNFAYENAGSFRDFAGNEQVFAAPVLTWEISPRTRITFELEYQNWNRQNGATFPLVDGRVFSFPISTNFTGPNSPAKNQGDRVLGGFNWSHDFNDNWKISHVFQANSIAYRSTSFFVDAAAANGDSQRFRFSNHTQDNTYFTSINLTGKFNTGSIKHTSLFGFDYFQLEESLAEDTNLQANFNVFNPNFSVNFDQLPVPFDTFRRNAETSWYGLYYQDQAELPYDLFALGGVRYDFAEDTDNLAGLVSDQDRVSPRGGILWHPVPEFSVYGSYTENFGANNGFDGNGRSLPAQTGQQWEAGIKTEFLDGRFSGTLAYFNLTRQNIAVTQDFVFFTTIGAAQSRGLEFDVAGEILPGWKIIGGYSYLPFAKVTGDIDGGNVGRRLPLAPEHSGSIWNTYEFQTGELRGLKFGAGVVGSTQRQGDTANTYQLPGYATVNLLASYTKKIGKSKVTAQLNVDNLLDKIYYTSNTGSEISPLAPRTFLGSIRVEY